ncbi:hypothetical protein [Rhodoblastus sp.]|jgi:hypothetical protein|uniref:hypothetical protein n=1 Tax=Rhodoblastus sp. TaxID=1962975 RepID=UPI0025DC8D6C|nr:hypothetical protein [Rhodoblastus sp.]
MENPKTDVISIIVDADLAKLKDWLKESNPREAVRVLGGYAGDRKKTREPIDFDLDDYWAEVLAVIPGWVDLEGVFREAAIAALGSKTRRKRTAEPSNKPQVRISAGRLDKITTEVQEALLDKGLYQRGSKIVRPGHIKQKDRDGETTHLPGIIELDVAQFRLHATERIDFLKWNKADRDWVPSDYSLEYANALLSSGDRLGFPLIRAVVAVPVVLENGRIIQTPGFDAETGIFFDPGAVSFPAIPDHPTKVDSEKALAALCEPLKEYPFALKENETRENNLSLSVALSYLLTIVNRPAFSHVPGHAFSGNSAGVGKGKLVAVGSILATGTTPGVIRIGVKEEEFEKALSTAMLQGRGHIAIDNVDQVLKGNLLDQAISEDFIDIRIFGRLESRTVPNIYTVTATGNNLIFTDDAVRRWLQSNIQTNEERPELKAFNFDPVGYARANRTALVVAALTILKAYIEAGRPKKMAKLGSFEDWSRMVREALIWLGLPDPIKSTDTIRANDPKKNLLKRFLEVWSDKVGAGEMSAKGLIDLANSGEADPLDLLLEEVTGGKVSPVVLGLFLRKIEGQIVGGKRLVPERARRGSSYWRLEDIQTKTSLF